MGWASKTNILSDASIDSTDDFSTAVTLNPGEIAHVEVKTKNKTSSSLTDDCVVSVYSTLDDTSEDWDNTALFSQTITASTNYIKTSFVVSGIYKFRFGLKSAGATDDYSATVNYRKDGVNL
jgi:hypothetical protein